MDVIMQMEPNVEVYSIDEAFIAFPTGKYLDIENYAGFLRDTVQKNTGIPVSIGFGPTKTLAKIANRFAKKTPRIPYLLSMTRTIWKLCYPRSQSVMSGVLDADMLNA